MPSDQPLQFPIPEETLCHIRESLARFHLASCQMRETIRHSFSAVSESRELLARADKLIGGLHGGHEERRGETSGR